LSITFTQYSYAESIKLKDGNIVQGKILSHSEDEIKVDIGIGVPISYYMDEVQSINGQSNYFNLKSKQEEVRIDPSSQPANQFVANSQSLFRGIEEYYGVKYDFRPMELSYNPSDLIFVVNNLLIDHDIEVNGVKVLTKGISWGVAKVVRTSGDNDEGL